MAQAILAQAQSRVLVQARTLPELRICVCMYIYIYIYTHTCIYLSLSLSLYIYIYRSYPPPTMEAAPDRGVEALVVDIGSVVGKV